MVKYKIYDEFPFILFLVVNETPIEILYVTTTHKTDINVPKQVV